MIAQQPNIAMQRSLGAPAPQAPALELSTLVSFSVENTLPGMARGRIDQR